MNTRRSVLIAFSVALLMPRAAFAQVEKTPVVIGWLSLGTRKIGSRSLDAFREGLAALGWKEGTQYVIEARWAGNQADRYAATAEELVASKPAVIVTTSHYAARVANRVAPNIPIVQGTGTNPVPRLAASLARPGGMLTGLTNLSTELSEKYIELLVEVAPKVRRVGFLFDGSLKNPRRSVDAVRRSAASYSVEPYFAHPATAEQIEPAMASLARQGVEALVMVQNPFLTNERLRVIALAQAQRWPIIAGSRGWVEDGALLSYGIDNLANFRRAAWYVDRILRGAHPGDLPIEQPMYFEVALNMKTAQSLGLTIPPAIMVRATHVIQ